jgi:DNA invertase Pin-like site-specific DNA recombinase
VGKAKRVAIYLLVSTTGQTVENQKRELEEAGSGMAGK